MLVSHLAGTAVVDAHMVLYPRGDHAGEKVREKTLAPVAQMYVTRTGAHSRTKDASFMPLVYTRHKEGGAVSEECSK